MLLYCHDINGIEWYWKTIYSPTKVVFVTGCSQIRVQTRLFIIHVAAEWDHTADWQMTLGVWFRLTEGRRDGGEWESEGLVVISIFLFALPDSTMSNIWTHSPHGGNHREQRTSAVTHRRLSRASARSTFILYAYHCVSEWETGVSKERAPRDWWLPLSWENNLVMMYSVNPQ